MDEKNEFKKEMQRLTNLIAATFGVDVAITSEGLTNIAGTKFLFQKFGLTVPDDSHVAKVLQTGEGFLVNDSSCSKECLSCVKKGFCPFEIVLLQPVNVGNLTKGVVTFLASNNRQKEIFSKKHDLLKRYASTTATLVSYLIEKEETKHIYQYLNPIYNSLDEGVLIISPEKNITYLNYSAEGILGCKINEANGQNIDTFFPHILPANLISLINNNKNIELFNRKEGLNITINPIVINNQLKEYVLLIKNQARYKLGKRYTPTNGNASMAYSEPTVLESIIGASKVITKLKTEILLTSKTDSTVLILGETGTGKELCAQTIHKLSSRRKGPFIAVNCGAIPDTLFESELFGYEDGAFTGARKTGKTGKFEEANNGTLFFDEIGDLPLSMQVKLLRVLESNKIERLGTNQLKSINVRIICATNQDLEAKIKKGEFRKDLYYRINVVPIFLPPLREHSEDVPLLLDFYLRVYQSRTPTNVREFSSDLVNLLVSYPWPGNIRELKNLVEYICSMEMESIATINSLPPRIKNQSLQNGTINVDRNELERLKIKQALRMFGNTTEGKKQAADYLGISLTTLYRKLKSRGKAE
ncbi:MAG: sigma-54 interaction domain-containing protein [Bacillota bacterium]